MRATQYTGTCSIRAPKHTISGKKKTTSLGEAVPNVPCRAQPLSDATASSIAGIETVTTYRFYFPPETVVADGYLITWKLKEFRADSVEARYGREEVIDHFEVIAHEQRIKRG